MNGRVIREETEEGQTEEDIKQKEEYGENTREDHGAPDHLLCALLLTCSDVLTDHGHCRILDSLADLVDDVVDAASHAEGSRGDHACAVDHGIDKEHGQIDKACLDRHGRAQGDDHARVLAVGNEAFLFEVKAELLAATEEIKQREEEGDRLTDDGRPCRTCHAPAPKTGKEDVEQKVHRRGDSDEEEGTLGVSHAAQNGGNQVIACREDQTRTADDHVVLRHIVGFCGHLDQRQDRVTEQKNDGSQSHRQHGDEGKERADDVVHFLFLLGAQRLGNEDLTAVGEAKPQHGGKVHDQAALRYGRKSCRAHELSHDQHIDGAVKDLQGVGRHEGQGKEDQLTPYISFGKIL